MRTRIVFAGSVLAFAVAFALGSSSCGLSDAPPQSSAGFAGGGATSGSAPGGSGGAGNVQSGSIANGSGSGPGGGFTEQNCKSGDVMVGLDEDKNILCLAAQPSIARAVKSGCSLYFGWHDSCNGCGDPPDRWGAASSNGCADVHPPPPGTTCADPELGGSDVALTAITITGNGNGDDHFYAGLHCPKIQNQGPHEGSCASGEAVVGLTDSGVSCDSVGVAALDFVRKSCAVYLGYHHNCPLPCDDVPTTWGFSGDRGCVPGSGSGNNARCDSFTLGDETLNMFGFNAENNIDNGDVFYMGLTCQPPMTDDPDHVHHCPVGSFATGTHANGTLTCTSLDPGTFLYFTTNCAAYLGWNHDCNPSCGPDKWGDASGTACEDGTPGRMDSCAPTTLDAGLMPNLFGLEIEQGVGDGDAFFAGMHCKAAP